MFAILPQTATAVSSLAVTERPHNVNEHYLPSYFFTPRPSITSAPAGLFRTGQLSPCKTPSPSEIAEVVLRRPGASLRSRRNSPRGSSSLRCSTRC
jgi:hypothetical protein